MMIFMFDETAKKIVVLKKIGPSGEKIVWVQPRNDTKLRPSCKLKYSKIKSIWSVVEAKKTH